MFVTIFCMLLIAFLAFKWFTWWLASAVLCAWIEEKEYASPGDEDRERLMKWVMQKTLKRE